MEYSVMEDCNEMFSSIIANKNDVLNVMDTEKEERHVVSLEEALARIKANDDNGLSVAKIPEAQLVIVDNFLWSMPVDKIVRFLYLVLPLLKEVRDGDWQNWRHDVYSGVKFFIGDGQVMRHHLTFMCTERGDISDSVNTSVTDFLLQHFPEDFDYVLKVLLPTTYIWLVILMASLNGPQARFYIENGGSHLEELSFQKMKDKVVNFEVGNSMDDNEEDEAAVTDTRKDQASKRTSQYVRPSRKCPECSTHTIHLPRHMRNIHKWSPDKAKNVVAQTDQRKSYTRSVKLPVIAKDVDAIKTNIKAHTRRRRRCPVDGCYAVIRKVSEHLRLTHKINPNSSEYKVYLENARTIRKLGGFPASTKTTRREVDVRARFPVDEEDGVEEEGAVEEVIEEEANERDALDESSVKDSECGQSSCEKTGLAAGLGDEDVTRLIMVKFLEYLVSPDGGKREHKSSSQTVNEVSCVVRVLGGKVQHLTDRLKVRDGFFRDYVDKRSKAGTAKHYLSSLINFMDFAVSDEISIPDVCSDDFLKMRLRLHQWRKTYTKRVEETKWSNEMEMLELLVTPEQCCNFEEGECARKATKVLCSAMENPEIPLTCLEFTNARDYLLASIALSNGHRSGVCANMTLDEYKKVAYDAESECYLISVKNHKTFQKHGPAVVCLTNQRFSLLKRFVECVRPKVCVAECDTVFVSWRGKKLESGAVSKGINAVWKRSGVYGDSQPPTRNMSTTVIRKSVTSLVHSQNRDQAQNVADLLSHNLSTAVSSYRVINRQKQAIAGSAAISNLMANGQEKSNLRLNKKWVREEECVLEKVFAKEIASGQVTMEDVRLQLTQSEIVALKRNSKQIYDKIRRIIVEKDYSLDLPTTVDTMDDRVGRMLTQNDAKPCVSADAEDNEDGRQSCSKEYETLDQDDDEVSIISPTLSTLTVGAEKVFSSSDTLAIADTFHLVVKEGPISVDRIKEVMENNDEAKEAAKRFTMFQLQNKIKHLRRKRRNASTL